MRISNLSTPGILCQFEVVVGLQVRGASRCRPKYVFFPTETAPPKNRAGVRNTVPEIYGPEHLTPMILSKPGYHVACRLRPAFKIWFTIEECRSRSTYRLFIPGSWPRCGARSRQGRLA